MECPLCKGLRSCRECAGLGAVTCVACDGLASGCEHCQRSGQCLCLPCDSTGACPRCHGEGQIEPAFPYY